MSNREFFSKRWKADRRAFVRVLEALPSDQLTYRPHERSTSAGDLAWQIAEEVRALAGTNATNELHFDRRTSMNPSRLVTLLGSALLIAIPLLAAPAEKTDAAPNHCSIPHYPIAVGNVNEYRMTSKQLDANGKVVEESTGTYRDEVVAVEADGFRTKTVTDGNAYELGWTCSAEGIAMKYDEQPETSLTSTGVVVPATMGVGDNWTQSSTVQSSEYTQTTNTVNRVTKREMVKVPVGEFEAWRIDYEVETTAEGREPHTARGTQWFVTGVGIVKSISVVPVEMEKTRQVETWTELISQITK